MPNNLQDNILRLENIKVFSELWNNHIFYIPIEENPYKFPKNDGSGDFLPKPTRFIEILNEFQEKIKKQRENINTLSQKKEAKEKIKEIYSQVQEQIQRNINILFTKGYLNSQQKENDLKKGLKLTKLTDLRKYNQEWFFSWFADDLWTWIDKLLDEWEKQEKIVNNDKNICFITNDNWDSLEFTFQPPQKKFYALNDFLWYKNNTWYETESWRRINNNNALIIVKRSHFIHNYSAFFLKGGNGIWHHHPAMLKSDEICMCPPLVEGTDCLEFICDWQPTYSLWKFDGFDLNIMETIKNPKKGIANAGESLTKAQNLSRSYLKNKVSETAVPIIHTLNLSKVEIEKFNRGLRKQILFLMPKDYNGEIIYYNKKKYQIL